MMPIPRTFRSLSPDEPSEWGKGYFLGARERREEGGGLKKEGGEALSRGQRRKLRKHPAAVVGAAVVGEVVGVLVLGRKAGVQGELGVADEAAKACLKRHTLKKGGKWCGGEGKWCGGRGC